MLTSSGINAEQRRHFTRIGSVRFVVTDFPLWSERFDREMKDVFEVQDEMARKIAEALRVTLSPEELEALAVKPTESLQAYDLYLRGKLRAAPDPPGPRVRPADVRKRGDP